MRFTFVLFLVLAYLFTVVAAFPLQNTTAYSAPPANVASTHGTSEGLLVVHRPCRHLRLLGVQIRTCSHEMVQSPDSDVGDRH